MKVDLKSLADRLGSFFKQHEFVAIMGESKEGYEIIAESSPLFELAGYVEVAIKGSPSDLTVGMRVCGEERQRGPAVGPLTMALFGGGYWLSRRLKSNEAQVRFEREFWRFVDNALLQLANSA